MQNKTSKTKLKICFVDFYSGATDSYLPFIKNDYEILKKHFLVDLINHPKKNTGIIPWIKYTFLMFEKVKKSDMIFSWFAGWHSAIAILISKLLRKKSVVVVGGFDVACIPEINYGAFAKFKEKIPAKYVLKKADLLLTVSEFTKKELLKRVTPKKSKIIYNCVEVDKIKPSKNKKENIIATIGDSTKKVYRVKGLDIFAKVSNSFPNYRFVLIGANDDQTVKKLKKLNQNLIFTGRIPHKEVIKWLQRTKIYCQLSYIESFGLGNAEAMCCKCIPIVTDSSALKEVVGNTGFYVSYGNEKETIEAIKKAIDNKNELGEKARERIINMFSLEKRENELLWSIKDLIKFNQKFD